MSDVVHFRASTPQRLGGDPRTSLSGPIHLATWEVSLQVVAYKAC